MRPQNLTYPNIFHKFHARDSESDEIIEYRVQDLPEELFEDDLHLYNEEFFSDEFMCSSKGLHEKDFETNEMIHHWREVLKHRLTLACFRNDENFQNEIVAANFLYICSKDDLNDFSKLKDHDVRDIYEAMEYGLKEVNVFEKYGVDRYLSECGLVVNRKYRKRGIATEILKARVPLMKALGLNVTTTCFSMIGSQKAAKNAGFVEDFVISYDDLAKVSPNFNFEKGLSNFFKIMSLKIE